MLSGCNFGRSFLLTGVLDYDATAGIDEEAAEEILSSFYKDQEVGNDAVSASPQKVSRAI